MIAAVEGTLVSRGTNSVTVKAGPLSLLVNVPGSLISRLGHKVLLVDADVATHGLSYFFVDQVQKATQSDLIISLNADGVLESRLVHIGDNFDIVPSKVELQRGERLLRTTEEIIWIQETSSRHLLEVIDEARPRYDFIIVDCQAGAVTSTYEVIKKANRVVSILEADPIGVWASRSLDRTFGDVFPEFTFYLVNKLFLEEVSQYNALTDYLRIFSHLPPLPFDFEVRRAFSRRVLPTESTKPSAFVFGLIRMLRDLLPAIDVSLNNLEASLREQLLGPVEKQIEELDSQILSLSEQQQLQRRRSRMFRNMVVVTTVSGIMVAALAVSKVFPGFADVEFDWMLVLSIMVSAMVVGVLSAALETVGRLLPSSPSLAVERLDLDLEKLREERKALVTYLATMSRDLILQETSTTLNHASLSGEV